MAPNKATKSMAKPIEKPISKLKKRKKKNVNNLNFSIYVYKVFKSIGEKQEHLRISRKTMMIVNSFVNDMLEKIAVEASRLVAHGKKTTLSSQDIQSAVKLLLPGELAKHANVEAIKALRLYHESHAKDK